LGWDDTTWMGLTMTSAILDSERDARPSALVLSRWDNEGGAGAIPLTEISIAADESVGETGPLTRADVMRLHVRTIALENLVIALLANASKRQLESVVAMASYIAPRVGHTGHPLTRRASQQMLDIVNRAKRIRPRSQQEVRFVCADSPWPRPPFLR
jgi:hypothetical protein